MPTTQTRNIVPAEAGMTCEIDACGAPATTCDLNADVEPRFFCAAHRPGRAATRRYLVTMGCAMYPIDATSPLDARQQARALYREQHGNYGMPVASALAADWREQIADAAVAVLTEPGVCVVRLGALPHRDETTPLPEVVSRLYKRSDYDTVRTMRRVAHSQATRAINRDCANYYVVERHDDGLVVWTGPNSILIQRRDG